MKRPILAGIFLAALFLAGCNEQEQDMRGRGGWPTASPSATASGNGSNAAQTMQPSYDSRFIDAMTAHHQQAVQMAQLAVNKAQHAELKEMARKMVNDQQQEIEQMRTWRNQWFPNQPQTGAQAGAQAGASPEGHTQQAMPGMSDSMQPMDMSRLQSATGRDFDIAFLEMMIPHHQGAVRMSQDALARAERQETQRLAQRINQSQQQEITRMEQWLNAWKNSQGRSKR